MNYRLRGGEANMKYRKEQQTTEPGKSRIPQFASRQEEADWFDTHDMADYQDEFKTVKARFANKLSELRPL
jgi:hypothetical protein